MDPFQYNYSFPKSLIANKPSKKRDAAKLLVYNRKTKKTEFSNFTHILKFLPPKSVLVFNETKVLPARLYAKKETGGKVEILYLGTKGDFLRVLLNKSLKPDIKLSISPKIFFIVKKKEEKEYLLKPSFALSKISSILLRYGHTPIPPYIKNSPLSEKELREKYQTVFAKTNGSVAAPTASLHFTKELLQKLKNAGHTILFSTLHVNLGTFAPLTEENLKTGTLHSEYFEIPKITAETITKAKKEGRTIIAVGTTVVRTLESAARNGKLQKLKGETNLFIREGYKFQIVDSLITNFHVPKSSLLILVSAFASRKEILNLYQKAIQKKFKLFSFGDGMLII